MTADEQHCLERLEYHESRLDKLHQLLKRSGNVVGRDDDLTRELLRSIKTGLKDEAHRSDTADGATALTDAERIWYHRVGRRDRSLNRYSTHPHHRRHSLS